MGERDAELQLHLVNTSDQVNNSDISEQTSATQLTFYHRARSKLISFHHRLIRPIDRLHARTPFLRTIPLNAVLIIFLLILINLVIWLICTVILVSQHAPLIGTAAIAYSLGLRHALDADHISAIDLMTRRLIASGQRPVTVGTFFSLGHSTIVVITSIVVAATAAGISHKFDGISNVGSIIGSAVSSAFLLILGAINAYILYKLIEQLRRLIRLPQSESAAEHFKIEGSGPLFRVLRTLFRLIDKPWKMYPLGVMFGLGFDTSSEVALLGISSIQGAKGTSIWLILIFPVLFTAGMCLVDTIDGALMLALYIKPMELSGLDNKKVERSSDADDSDQNNTTTTITTTPTGTTNLLEPEPEAESKAVAITLPASEPPPSPYPPSQPDSPNNRAKDPLLFLYYSTLLTALTVLVAVIIGTLQLLTLIQNVTHNADSTSTFWKGVTVAGDHYEEIGGGICASFVVVGVGGVLGYKPWRRWVERRRGMVVSGEDGGGGERVQEGLEGERDVGDSEEVGGAAAGRGERGGEVFEIGKI